MDIGYRPVARRRVERAACPSLRPVGRRPYAVSSSVRNPYVPHLRLTTQHLDIGMAYAPRGCMGGRKRDCSAGVQLKSSPSRRACRRAPLFLKSAAGRHRPPGEDWWGVEGAACRSPTLAAPRKGGGRDPFHDNALSPPHRHRRSSVSGNSGRAAGSRRGGGAGVWPIG